MYLFCDKATGQPFKTWAVVGRGESHKKHRALHWIFHLRKLTAVDNVADDSHQRKDNCPGWNLDNKQFQDPQVASSLAESSICTKLKVFGGDPHSEIWYHLIAS